MGVVDGIMGITADVMVDMAMSFDCFDDGANGVRMRVGCHHWSGEQRGENHGDERCQPCEPALMHALSLPRSG